jgi:hypothetical protein
MWGLSLESIFQVDLYDKSNHLIYLFLLVEMLSLRIDLSRPDEIYNKSQFDNIREILFIMMRHCIKIIQC